MAIERSASPIIELSVISSVILSGGTPQVPRAWSTTVRKLAVDEGAASTG